MELLENYAKILNKSLEFHVQIYNDDKLYKCSTEQYLTINGEKYLLSQRVKNSRLILINMCYFREMIEIEYNDLLERLRLNNPLNRDILKESQDKFKDLFICYILDCLQYVALKLKPNEKALTRILDTAEKHRKDLNKELEYVYNKWEEMVKDLDGKCKLYEDLLQKDSKYSKEESKKLALIERVSRSELIQNNLLKTVKEIIDDYINRFYQEFMNYFHVEKIFFVGSFIKKNINDIHYHPYNKELWLPLLSEIKMKDWGELYGLFEYYNINIKEELEDIIIKDSIEHYKNHNNYNFPAKMVLLYRFLDYDENTSFSLPEEGVVVEPFQSKKAEIAFYDYFKDELELKIEELKGRKYISFKLYKSNFENILKSIRECPLINVEKEETLLEILAEVFKRQ